MKFQDLFQHSHPCFLKPLVCSKPKGRLETFYHKYLDDLLDDTNNNLIFKEGKNWSIIQIVRWQCPRFKINAVISRKQFK